MSAVQTLLLSLLVAGLPASAKSPEPRTRPAEATAKPQSELEAYAELCFAQAVGGEKASVDPGFEAYGKLIRLQPTQATWLCRYGSLSAMKGRDAALPEEKLAFVQRGLEAMGRAVALAPDDVSIRFTRASTCAALPPFLHQVDTAIQDCQHLEGLFARTPASHPLEIRMQNRLLLAQTLQKAGRSAEARKQLEQVQAEAPGTPFAQKAQELLK